FFLFFGCPPWQESETPPMLKPQHPQTPTRPQHPQPPQKKPYPQKHHDSQHPQHPQHPNNPQVPVIPQLPDTYKSCQVPDEQKVKCGAPDISAAHCEAINCCHDGHSCFYGKVVTLQCTKDGQFIIVIARDATLPSLDLESISFLDSDPSCAPVGYTSAFAVFQFPVTHCGTVMTEEPGMIVYENRLSCSYEVLLGPFGAITRDTQFDLSVQCRYVGTTVEALVVEISGLSSPYPVVAPGPLHVELRIANGICNTKGCNDAYTSFYADSDYPVTKVLREPVYVGVHILDRSDPNLVLTLGRCWATADMYPDSHPQWDLLVDGCPYRDDRYQTSLLPIEPLLGLEFPRHHRHFMFKMFTFVSLIYIHCQTAVCTPTAGDNCEPRCFRKSKLNNNVSFTYFVFLIRERLDFCCNCWIE
uniref:Zona pellucida sperm-binding protein 4 n=1 Tax=Gouania willdenowi TaxID=441366 RepID=A0A8C5D683_GOUWI